MGATFGKKPPPPPSIIEEELKENNINKYREKNREGRTPALCPSALRCWGKPPSLVLGSTVSWQSPAVAPPGLAGSSSPRRPSAASICWRSAPHRWTGCRRIKTSRPAKGSNPRWQLDMTPAQQQAFFTLQERESHAFVFGNSLSSSRRASASLILGIVSKARMSASAAARHSICGRCHALSS